MALKYTLITSAGVDCMSYNTQQQYVPFSTAQHSFYL